MRTRDDERSDKRALGSTSGTMTKNRRSIRLPRKLRRKLTRLLIGSFGIMGLGFVAVFIAILYRTGCLASLKARPRLWRLAQRELQSLRHDSASSAGERIVGTDLDGGSHSAQGAERFRRAVPDPV
jgi:hypothetical protein